MSPLEDIPRNQGYHCTIRDIPYDRNGAERAVGDLFLPQGPPRGAPVLLIHGGGWNALSKESFEFMLPIFALAGRPAFNVNYRLLSQAPWPACGEDCELAAQFLLRGGLTEYGLKSPEKILICGASAGGHLAMMTGLSLPADQVEGIVSMAGPSRLDWVATNPDPTNMHEGFYERFFGTDVAPDDPVVAAASPAIVVEKTGKIPPPLFCFHSSADELCPPRTSEEAVAAWTRSGGYAEVTYFEGDENLHGFFVNNDRPSAMLRPEAPMFFARVFDTLANA
ncbi:MAG: alpha/beta hydrolase [Terrimicrobiaceae bacterium]